MSRIPVLWAVAGLALGLAPTVRGQSVAQVAYLKAAAVDVDDHLGRTLAIDGDTLVVGVYGEDGSIPGVDGDPEDDGASSAGAAYVFVRQGGAWVQQAYLKASNPGTGDNFGRSVALSGDTIVVGARDEDSRAKGVDGNQADNTAPDAGAAYVFVRNGTTWSQQAYLKASNTNPDDRFGSAVAVWGDTVAVGADLEDSTAVGVGGEQFDNGAPSAGAVYVFVRDGTTWSQQAYLKASNTDAGDRFGYPLAIEGDTLVVGAEFEDGGAVGVGGDEGDDSAPGAGAAYVFVRDGATWSQQAYLKASNTDAGDGFGSAVAVSGDTVVVGARSESGAGEGVGGDPEDDGAPLAGAAYVFVRAGTAWSQQAYLKPFSTDAGDGFGWSAGVWGDTLVVGSREEDSAAVGIDGDPTDDGSLDSGAAYLFTREGATWSPGSYLKSSNSDPNDVFGIAVAISSDAVVVGSIHESSQATGVDGDQSDNSVYHAGAAYVFTLESPWEDLGSALAGTRGEPALAGTGTLVGGQPMSIRLTNALASAPAFLFLGLAALDFSPFYGGTLVPDFTVPPGQIIVVFIDPAGELTLGTTWPSGVPAGLQLYLQYWIGDAGGPFGFAASNALRGTTP